MIERKQNRTGGVGAGAGPEILAGHSSHSTSEVSGVAGP